MVDYLSDKWQTALGRAPKLAFQPTQGNRRRIEIYDALIDKAQLRAELAGTVAARRVHLQLIARLDARCRREVRRREDESRP